MPVGRRHLLPEMVVAALITTLLAAVAVGALVWWNGGVGSLVGRQRCVASAAGSSVTLSPDQARQAATITAITAHRNLPQRAATIALATALQESKLTNLSHGDRDSAGLFQQRPSQGWGTFQQVTNPRYATDRFLSALVDVPNWQHLPVTVAAQRVQRSAFPDAYRQHAVDARVLAASLSGKDPASFTCTVHLADVRTEQPTSDGFTQRTQHLRNDLTGLFAAQVTAVSSGSAVAIRPSSGDANARQVGWAIAHWLVANADRLHVTTVVYQRRIWDASHSPDGWQVVGDVAHPSGPSTLRVVTG